jgi:hypothetical protein
MARPSRRSEREPGAATRENLGFLLARASQRWNELLHELFAAAGYPEVRPSYGSILLRCSRRTASAWGSSPPVPG